MVWKQATDPCAGTAVIYGAPDVVKISQLFSDTDVTDTVTIHESVNWTFQSDGTTGDSLRISNPAQTFNYNVRATAIGAQRDIILPLLIGDDTFVFEAHIQVLTNKTVDLDANTLTGTKAEFNTAVQADSIGFFTDKLCVFAATSSAELITIISDESGSGLLVFNCSPTIVTPTIAATGWTNATHAHLAANSGGQVTEASISDLQSYLLDATGSALLDARFWIGSGANVAAELTISGEVTVANTGVATIANNVIGLAELAGGTDGELYTFDVCGNPAFVAVGCCGQILTSNGVGAAPTFQAAGAADNLGNHTATCCLVMGTNAITFGVDAAAPAACVSYHTYLAAGPVYNAIPCDIHDFKINAVSQMTIGACVINAPTNTFQEAGIDISPVGTHTQWIPAGSWGTVTTNGAEFAELELATNDIMLQTFNFDTTTSEKIQFWWEPPAEWNAGTITFNAKWTEVGGGACETVIFSLAGHSYTDDDAIDAAIGGTPATVTDTNKDVDNDMHKSPESTAVTINGATKGEAVLLQISRTISDTLAVDAKLIGINITYTTDVATAT